MTLSELLKSSIAEQLLSPRRERARVLIRVSHERSAEKAISPETQRRRIEAYAQSQGYDIFEWYTELAKSAFRDDEARTEYHRLIADCKADPETSVILVYRYDRFSRGESAQTIQRDLLRHGVRIESAEEGYYDPDTETGAIMMPLTWSLNRLFSIKLRNVVIPNMKVNFEQRDPGTGWAYKNGGWAQFGYKAVRIPAGRRKSQDIYKMIWMPDDREYSGKAISEWARIMLLDWRLAEQLGYDAIAGRLTRAGVPTPSGRSAWCTSSIQALLGEWDRVYQYAGYAFWNREDCTERGNRRKRDTSEWVVVENAHPAIITEEEAGAIYAMVGDKKRLGVRNNKVSRFALSGGLVKCAICGSNYAGAKRGANDYYVCGSHLYRRGAGCGKSWYIPREQLEQFVLSKIMRQLVRDDRVLQAWVDELNNYLAEQWKAHVAGASKRRKEMKTKEHELSRLVELSKHAGTIPTIAEQIKGIDRDIMKLRIENEREKPGLVSMDKIKAQRSEVEKAFASQDAAVRSRILWDYVVEITANGDTKTLEGILNDPRSIQPQKNGVLRSKIYRGLAAPRGVEPLPRP